MYNIGGKSYKLKERYSLKEWGLILKILSSSNGDIVVLLAEDKLKEILTLILDPKIDTELYEEDIDEIARAIKDFFSRKNNMMKNMDSSSKD